MNYKLIDAQPKDGKKILELIETSPSKGMLKLLYTRRPDAYQSYKKENPNSIIKLVKAPNDDIMFQVAILNHKLYIENQIKDLYYVGGLKKNPIYREQIHWTDMFVKLNDYLPYHEFYCSVLNDNKHAKDVLLKKRKDWPGFHEVCHLSTNIFTPKAVLKNEWDHSEYHLEQLHKSDRNKVLDFLNKEGRKYNFFPVINSFEDFYDLDIHKCFVLKKDDEILGFTALWNQERYKQFVVKKYGFPLNILSKLNFITKQMGYISFPKADENFSFHYLSFFLVKDQEEELYKTLLYKICKEVNKKIDSLVLGTTNEALQETVFQSFKKISFNSTIYYIYYGKEKKLKKPAYIECALL